jgi:hypothetical protein
MTMTVFIPQVQNDAPFTIAQERLSGRKKRTTTVSMEIILAEEPMR